jgi:predicted MFS family arabinose efflux permease
MTDDDARDRSAEESLLEVPLPHAEAPSAAPRLLTNRPFLWLVAGDSFATLGRWAFFLAAVGDAAYRLDASPAQVGFVLASFSLPLIVVSPLYGAAADRWSPKLLLVFTVAASVGPPFVAIRANSLASLFVATMLYGLLHGAVMPSRGALVPRLVPADQLVRANGMISAAFSAQLVVGPALAALLVRLGGPHAPYLVTVGASALAFVAYLAVPDRRKQDAGGPGQAILAGVSSGFREGWRNPALRNLLGISVSIWFLIGLLIALEPLYIKDDVGGGQDFLGVVWAVYGAGEVAGSVLLARTRRGAGREPSLVAFGLLLASVGFLLYVSVASPVAVIAGNVVFGIGFPFYTATSNALIQRVARHPGKVTAAFSMAGEGGPVAAAVLLAVAGGALSVRGWLLVSGVVFTVVALAALGVARRQVVRQEAASA